jgi:hypothetical protein
MLYLGSLLHIDVKTVAYVYYWLVFASSALSPDNDLQCSLNFLINRGFNSFKKSKTISK